MSSLTHLLERSQTPEQDKQLRIWISTLSPEVEVQERVMRGALLLKERLWSIPFYREKFQRPSGAGHLMGIMESRWVAMMDGNP
jgi:hypothetical protein